MKTPQRRLMYPLLQLAFLCLLIPADQSPALASRDTRPFWAEKSAYVEGDELFVVGIASKARTAEEGRQQAFMHGKIELTNYAQISSLESNGLVIETQMTHEEENTDGTVNVFRLLRVPIAKLIAIQGRLERQTQVEQQALEQAQRDLLETQRALYQKQQEAEKLLRLLKSEFQLSGRAIPYPSGSLEQDLRQTQAALADQEKDVDKILTSVRQRVKTEHEKLSRACSRLIKGMTKGEVVAVIGNPQKYISPNVWRYGRAGGITVSFDEIEEVKSISRCESVQEDLSQEKVAERYRDAAERVKELQGEITKEP